MPWFTEFSAAQPVAAAVLILALVAFAGLVLGEIEVRGIKLGVAGVLFAGIVFGHFHLTLPPAILSFARDFGLILFVYTIGIQVGPGFFASLRRNGLPLNALATGIVVAGAVLTVTGARLFRIDMAAAVGIFAGATTNTPSLGAAQEALKQIAGLDAAQAGQPAMGYAIAYPFGIIGIVVAMIAVRAALKVRPDDELKAFEQEREAAHPALQRMNILVCNCNLNGLKLHEIPGRESLDVIISRIRYVGEDEAAGAHAGTVLHEGDVILAVGTPSHLHELCLIVGRESSQDLREAPGPMVFEQCIVTRREILGQTIGQLHLVERYGVTVTRVRRGDTELSAASHLAVKFGDVLQVVGRREDVSTVAALTGDSVKELNRTHFIPTFLGIGAGILLGLYPLSLPGIATPVRLGLAGGPLLAAIALSRLGRIGPLVWYLPPTANLALRELGIILFLACAGLKAGEHFMEVLRTGQGPQWMALGAVVTLVPLLLAALLGRLTLRLRFITLCGLLAGSMTDPPALAFANSINKSDAPSVAYAMVYPLTMLLRILVAQILVVIFIHA